MYKQIKYAKKYTFICSGAGITETGGSIFPYTQSHYTTFKRKLQHKKLAFSSFLVYNLIKGKCKIFN